MFYVRFISVFTSCWSFGTQQVRLKWSYPEIHMVAEKTTPLYIPQYLQSSEASVSLEEPQHATIFLRVPFIQLDTDTHGQQNPNTQCNKPFGREG